MGSGHWNSPAVGIKKLSMEVAQRAVEWQLEWRETENKERTWQSILDWRAEDHSHEIAWKRIETIGLRMQPLASDQGLQLVHATFGRISGSRRVMLKKLTLLLVFGGFSGWGYQRKPWDHMLADYTTVAGEQKTFLLADGTQISLNSDSAVNVNYTQGTQYVDLLQGEIYLASPMGKPHRLGRNPLVVKTGFADIRPIGTRFSVRKWSDSGFVSVHEGQVSLSPLVDTSSIFIDQGWAHQFNAFGWSDATPVGFDATAWLRGNFVASNMRLDVFVTELQRHRAGVLSCDPAIADLRISGTYPITQPDRVLQTLAEILPIRLQKFSNYWIRILPA